MKTLLAYIVVTVSLGFLTPSAFAQSDPFLANSGDGSLAGEFEQRSRDAEDQKTFTGSIERLLDMAGQDSSKSEHWKEFEDVSGTPAEENYHSTIRWKMEKENKKPIPRRKSFDSTIESVAEHLERIKPTKARQRREKLRDHY